MVIRSFKNMLFFSLRDPILIGYVQYDMTKGYVTVKGHVFWGLRRGYDDACVEKKKRSRFDKHQIYGQDTFHPSQFSLGKERNFL